MTKALINDDHVYLDYEQLRARGWTRTLVKRFLTQPDRWDSVDHWQNYKGKAMYFVKRIIQMETSPAFKEAFAASAKRRKLTPEVLDEMRVERDRTDLVYRAWLKTVMPEDVLTMTVIQDAARTFDRLRTRG